MQLKIGNTPFDVNSVWIDWTVQIVRNEADQPIIQRIMMNIRGYLSAVGQPAITTQINNLRAALIKPYQDLIFYQDNGAKSAHLLTNSDSLSGVVIVSGPNFPASQGPEYATQREFTFSATADYAVPGSLALLVSFTESLVVSGGQPLYVVKEAVNGPPQRQLVYPSSAYVATQSGEAVGFLGYPQIPGPMFPDAMRGGRDNPRISKRSPKRTGNNYIDWPIAWEYSFESPDILVGSPNIWR